MSKGYSGLFNGTQGLPVPGSIDLMRKGDDFIINMRKSHDIDTNGRLDIIAHGGPHTVKYQINGMDMKLNHRDLAALIKARGGYKGKIIRLLSCETGADPNGFAQNLANKLNMVVEAPNKLLWAEPSGIYYVASRDKIRPKYPNMSDKGEFVMFYPGGNKNGRKKM